MIGIDSEIPTIIQPGWTGLGFPFERLPPEVALEVGAHRPNKFVARAFRMLECFLQVTGREWAPLSPSHPSVIAEFIGALYSETFLYASMKQRRTLAIRFLSGLAEFWPPGLPAEIEGVVEFHTDEASRFAASCKWRFSVLEIDKAKADFWRGWPIHNAAGRQTWLPLAPLYQHCGSAFTSEFHKALATWYGTGRSDSIPVIAPFCEYVEQLAVKPSPSQFQDERFMLRFWKDFGYFYVKSRAERGQDIGRLTGNWQRFGELVGSYLTNARLFVAPLGGFPKMPRRQVKQARLRIADGITYMDKLLTPVPLEVTDEEALEILFKNIEQDVGVAVKWAAHAVADLTNRIRRSRRWSLRGQPREVGTYGVNTGGRWLNSPDNPDRLINAAATLARIGYRTQRDMRVHLLFPIPLAETARALGLPVAGSLLPHCILLVHEHPEITPAFLEQFEVFDKHGQQVGLHKTPHGWVLRGYKRRKGGTRAEQVVSLNRRSFRAIAGILRSTKPIREYLKLAGDDNWRRLLLSCGQAFSYPSGVRLVTLTSQSEALDQFAEALGDTWNATYERRREYAHRFSLPALRASVGVLIYIKTRDATTFAEALGHTSYSPKLLSRYLPEPILQFFQDRWIRLFQEGLVLQAMENSPLLLQASSFESMDEVSQFLRNHAVRFPPIGTSNTVSTDSCMSAFVGLNAEILSLLLSLKAASSEASQPISISADFWAAFASRVEQDITSGDRDDLKGMLEDARQRIDAFPFRAIVNV